MRVQLNGEARDFRDGATLHDLVVDLGLTQRRIAVEINREILPRESYAQRPLRDGDVIEIVHFIGGG